MTKRYTRKYRLFKYAQQCNQSGAVIDDVTAEARNLITRSVNGAIIRVSDDLIDLGNYTEVGHRRLHPESGKYF